MQAAPDCAIISDRSKQKEKDMEYTYRVSGVCSRSVTFDLSDDNKVSGISFVGGCDGNLKAVGKLCEGRDADEIINILKGNTCGLRKTSCADQFARALEAAKAERA